MTLDLDARQRAMLAEMGVRVWWPDTVDAPPAQATATASADPARASPALTPSVPPPAPAPRAPTPSPVTVPAVALTQVSRPNGVERMDWAALQSAVAACQACGLCQSRKRTVFGVGAAAPEGAPPHIDWMIVGEAPGENEDLQGEPFVGQAGKLLDNMLKACGLSRHGGRGANGGGVYIANVLKCRPPGNRNPQPDEVAQCEPYLQRQIELLQPKIILAMGRFAVQSLLAESAPEQATLPLGKLRGRVYAYRGVPVVVTYHPAYLLRSPGEKAKAWADLCLAMAHLQGRTSG